MTERGERRETMRKNLRLGAVEVSLIWFPAELGPVSDGEELLAEQLAALREFVAKLEETIAAPLPPQLRAD
jgi:hypothetical protein